MRRDPAIPRIDLHVHSHFSPCAKDVSMYEEVRVAIERGVSVIAITDHGTTRQPSWLEDYFRELEDVRSLYGDNVIVLSGMEVDILDSGRLAVSREILKMLDVVVASIHRVPPGCDVAEYWRRSMLGAIRSGLVDILGHPTDVGWKTVRPPLEYVLEVLDEARSAGVAVELNYHHRDPQPYFLKLAIERRVKLVPNSDAHSLSEIGAFSWHEEIIRSLGYDPSRVNWLELSEAMY